MDTGACRSLIRHDVFIDICKAGHRVPVLSKAPKLFTVTGAELPCLGKTMLELLGKSCEVFVVPNLAHSLLLGVDFLDVLEAKIELGKRLRNVILNGVDFKCKFSSKGKRATQIRAVDVGQTEMEKWAQLYPDVFGVGNKPLTQTETVSMKIDTGSHPPIQSRPYRVPLLKRKIINDEINEMLKNQIIEPSSGPWASPITLVPKPDGTIRFCVDYRRINSVTVRDAGHVPNIHDILDSLSGATCFSTLDLRSGYWQIPMHPDSMDKTAFISHRGLFRFFSIY